MEVSLAAVTRAGRGKNEARRLRRDSQIPAVVYGGETPGGTAIAVDPKTLLQILRSESGVNTLIDLTVDGGKASQVLVKEFQLDPIGQELLHVDFYHLAMDKAITVTVPVVLKGEPAGVKQQDGVLDFVNREVQVECMPNDIPENLEVDVSELMIGDGVRLSKLLTDVNWTSVSEPEMLLAHVIAPRVQEEEAAAAVAEDGEAVAEGADEGSEPEVIKKGKTGKSWKPAEGKAKD